MTATEIKGGGLGDINFAATAAVGFLNPLGAQIDGFLAATLGPLTASLTASMHASYTLSASLGVSIADPLEAIKLALLAVVQLQAALKASLMLPPLSIGFSAQASTALSLAASLQATLGILNGAVTALLNIKIPALEMAAQAVAALSTPGASLVKFGPESLVVAGVDVANLFVGGLPQGGISPVDSVVGYAVVVKDVVGAAAALDFIFTGS